MTKSRDASVKTEAIGKNVLDVVRTDGLEICIMCTLCYNYYGLALSNRAVLNRANVSCLDKINHAHKAYLLNNLTHLVLPRICLRWTFWNEDKVCARA
jgi:hypothetical protein